MVFAGWRCLLSNCAWTAVLSLLDLSWTSLEPNLEPLGRLLERLGQLLEPLGRLVDPTWSFLGASWSALGRLADPTWRLLAASWSLRRPLGADLGALGRLLGNPRRT